MKLLLSILAAILLLQLNLNAQLVRSDKDNSLTVKGTAILKQTPELLVVRITLQSHAEKYRACQEKLVKTIDFTRSLLIKYGLEEASIHSNDLNVGERRDYLPNGSSKVSFEGNAVITIENNYTAAYAQKLLSALQSDSVSLTYNLEFTLSEYQKRVLRQKAIEVAIEDAREKAEAIAKAAGVKLWKINSITYNDDEYGRGLDSDLVRENSLFSGNAVMFKSSGQAPEINFNPKEIGVKKTISVEWSMEEKR